tara:strand:- start:17589 stop:17801 length:213 start_codon:yes stop_codon:yes gene_type:complete
VRRALTGGRCSPELSSHLITYTVATTFSISPVEVYKMPASLVKEMLVIHKCIKELEAEEMDKMSKKNKMR